MLVMALWCHLGGVSTVHTSLHYQQAALVLPLLINLHLLFIKVTLAEISSGQIQLKNSVTWFLCFLLSGNRAYCPTMENRILYHF